MAGKKETLDEEIDAVLADPARWKKLVDLVKHPATTTPITPTEYFALENGVRAPKGDA